MEQEEPAELGFLTTRELATLLRVKERKVYSLVAEGSIPHRRVTGKLLFSKDEIEDWVRDAPGTNPPAPFYKPSAQALQVVAGGEDPLLEWALRESGSNLAVLFDGHADGAARLKAREAVATSLNVYDEASGDWNVPFAAEQFSREPVVLISFARRSRGFLIRPENAATVKAMADLSGKRVGIRDGAADNGLAENAPSSDRDLGGLTATWVPTRTEIGSAVAVLSGTVDAAIGLQATARQFNLGYIPLADERYDLLVFRRAYFEQPLQKLFRLLRTPSFADMAKQLSGYDLADLGKIRFNGL